MTNNDKWIDEFHNKELLDRPKYCWEKYGKTCLDSCLEETCPLNVNYHKEETSATIH